MSQFKYIEDVPADEEIECTECGEQLKRAVWLELDNGSNRYTDAGDVPAEYSQGWHPFGTTCAAKMLKQ